MTTTFYILLSLLLYCYLGYPVLIWLIAKIHPWPVRKDALRAPVSILLSVHNEEDVINGKLENLLGLNYDYSKLEILIGSDGSDDRTNEIVEKFNSPYVHLFKHKARRGKAAVLNELAQHAKGEILIFTDARQAFDKDAVMHLVENFADEQVGCVSGELEFFKEEGGTARGINLYWSYEKFIRHNESRVHSMLGATGAIYAIRKALFCTLPEVIVLDDMYIPFKIIQKKYRAIFDSDTKAYDKVATRAKEEHRRKARTLYGNYQIFARFPGLFNPFVSPIAVQLFSHKFLRVCAPFLLIALFIINWLISADPFYFWFLVAQFVFYGMAVTGGLLRNKKYAILKPIMKACYAPYVFCLLNFSALVGFFRFIFARQDVTWKKAREKS